ARADHRRTGSHATRDTGSLPSASTTGSRSAIGRQSGAHPALLDPPVVRAGDRQTGPAPRLPSDAELLGLARACADAAARASDADRLERAFRGHSVAAQLAQRGREPALARIEADRARAAPAAMAT